MEVIRSKRTYIFCSHEIHASYLVDLLVMEFVAWLQVSPNGQIGFRIEIIAVVFDSPQRQIRVSRAGQQQFVVQPNNIEDEIVVAFLFV